MESDDSIIIMQKSQSLEKCVRSPQKYAQLPLIMTKQSVWSYQHVPTGSESMWAKYHMQFEGKINRCHQERDKLLHHCLTVWNFNRSCAFYRNMYMHVWPCKKYVHVSLIQTWYVEGTRENSVDMKPIMVMFGHFWLLRFALLNPLRFTMTSDHVLHCIMYVNMKNILTAAVK